MKHSNISVGLDIGTTKIVAMVGDKNEFGKVEILGIGKSKSLGVHRGVVNNITQTIQSIQQAVEEAKVVSGKEIDEVVVGIAVNTSGVCNTAIISPEPIPKRSFTGRCGTAYSTGL